MPSSVYPEPVPTALTDHLTDTADSHDASAVSFTPAGTIAATDVQAAIEEVAAEASGVHPDLATHDGLGLATDAELAAHTGDATDAHDASAISFTPNGSIAATDVQAAIQEVRDEAAGGGAPSTADYLVGTADGGLSNEIVVGTTPGGELGGTWASPTVDATHSGSTHSAASDTHVADTTAAHVASSIGFTPNGSIAATDVQAAIQEVRDEAGGGGAPTTADYLVGTAQGGLSAEIVVGATPGGELGGTWAAPTVDAIHAGGVAHDLVLSQGGADGNITNADATYAFHNVTGLVAGSSVLVDAWFTILNNSGATRIYTITLDFDALFDIELATGATANSATLMHPFRLQAVLDVRSTSLAYAMVTLEQQLLAGIASGTDTTTAATHLHAKGWGTTASDASGTTTASLLCRSAATAATQTFRLHHFSVRKFN